MNQQTKLQSLDNISNQITNKINNNITKEFCSQKNIQIKSKVPIINYTWIKKNIIKFLEEKKIFSSIKDISIYFTEQSIKKNIIRCYINIKLKNNTLTASGQGIDEYQAIDDLLKNLELEALIELNSQKSHYNSFFSNSINKFQNNKQYT